MIDEESGSFAELCCVASGHGRKGGGGRVLVNWVSQKCM